MKYLNCIIITLSLTLFLSCNNAGNVNSSYIPNVQVNYRIVLSDSRYFDLATDGGYVYVPDAGYRGLLVYRHNASTYSAFDRASPYAPDKVCSIIIMNPSRFYMEDTCSKSTFDLLGNVTGGPAPGPLKKYYTQVSNGYELLITNAATY